MSRAHARLARTALRRAACAGGLVATVIAVTAGPAAAAAKPVPGAAAIASVAAATGPQLGAATTAPHAVGSALVQSYAAGIVVYTRSTGAQPVLGALAAAYEIAGGAAGRWGVPVAPARPVGAGAVQAFSAVTSYVALGAGVHSLSGGWQARYAALGGPTGFLGFPVSDPAAVAGGARLAFQGGAMYGGPTGVHTMSAAADGLYQRYGGPAGTLGLPVSDAVPVGSGVRQSLAHGDLWYSAATGLHVTLGAIGTYYTARGGAAGPLGFPRSDEFAGAIGREVLFQHGAVAYSPHYGVLAGPAVTAIDAAMSKLGAPYQWGAAGPDRFDCSGLVAWAFAQAGVRLPHFTGDQVKLGRRVDAAHLVPGDLVFFGADFGHVGIYLGDGRYVHAPHTGDVVRVSPIGATAPSAAVRLG